MTTLAACGDVNRNVMCSPLPAQSSYHREVYACSRKISDHLLPSTTAYHEIWLTDDHDKKTLVAGDAVQDFEPLYGPTYLPRKFKIAIAIPRTTTRMSMPTTSALIAIKTEAAVLPASPAGRRRHGRHTQQQEDVSADGRSLGFVKASEVHVACEKVMLVQRDHGDRKNRKHARLKYTIDDMGLDVFGPRSKTSGAEFEKPRPFHFESNIDTFGWTRDETGMNHFTFFIENGRVEDTAAFQMKTGLREVAKAHRGEFRLTPTST